jgi:hypothetical protein
VLGKNKMHEGFKAYNIVEQLCQLTEYLFHLFDAVVPFLQLTTCSLCINAFRIHELTVRWDCGKK